MRLRHGTVATAIIFFTSFLSLSWYTAWQNGKEKLVAYQREFHALRERLRAAEHRTLQRSSELNAILEQFRRAIAETNGSKDALSNFSDETQKLLKELAHRKPLQVPNIYHHLPHLLNNEGSLHPAVQVGQGRTGVSMVMGIPTVKRKVKSYLSETLHSLIDKLSAEEKLDCVIIVFVGETDIDYVNSVVAGLEKEFYRELNSGLLEVISPPASYYPDFSNLKETFGDSKERVKWRTKQNLDYSFLMMYAVNKGVYYVQLEDDIVAKPNYFATMKNFALQLATEDWMILEFSQLGFIGDKDFLKPLLHKIHMNPPAEVSTSLKVYQGHTLEKTYMGEDFFWAITPMAGDFVLFKFDRPVNIERPKSLSHWSWYIKPSLQLILLVNKTRFEKGVAEGTVDPAFNPVVAVRLTVQKNSAVWAIISEVCMLPLV
ncbi:alpha-1,3-mannosyl-glycoprotein 4-beta-N-acetylglucosaminyltransferase A-like [Sinocyclocheilus grahami]|uniref:alpha-1,3-mannosyl-glycoprotein 4-beta-N-acetylglucosaminyltransferase A-like n=1 Tax=Sinocyclocheilus grahami TaxID=75366 RepID=UPI0007AD677E|nr:PREDICTED: alpha-1,3-mannosyl-glycoprotein 4-beta-N-acetylglucosaminyltransferase A-like [Sinocyclocheilus grahami]